MSAAPLSGGRAPAALRHVLAWALTAWIAACGGEEPSQEAPATPDRTPAEEIVAEEAPTPPARRFLPDEMRRSGRPESFPHDPHVRIDCRVCHEEVPGHGSHGDVACAECHRSSAQATIVSLTPDECLSCHHGPDQTLGCAACHATPAVLTSTQTLHMDVWEAPRSRDIAFDHGRHGQLDCAACHREAPELAADSCASCHETHHTSTSRCAVCHVPPPEDAHGVQVHLGCGGSGCHDEPLIESRLDTRPVCLVCHQEQEDHEPGGVCVDCHKVRSLPSAAPADGRVSGASSSWHRVRGKR